MRRKLTILVLSLMILCLVPIQMNAIETNQTANFEVNPLWTYIIEFTNSFDISSNGLALVDTSIYARSEINKVVIKASIQQYKNGSWQTIKSWTSTSAGSSGDLTVNWYLMSGYYYRMVSSGEVYRNGVLVEQTSYNSPSYWY